MRVWLEHDAGDNAWVLRHQDVVLDSEERIAEWESLLLEGLSRVEPPIALLIDMHGFTLHPHYASRYGSVARRIMSTYATHAGRIQVVVATPFSEE